MKIILFFILALPSISLAQMVITENTTVMLDIGSGSLPFDSTTQANAYKEKHGSQWTQSSIRALTQKEKDDRKEVIDNKNERIQLKKLLSTINNSNLPEWHKRLHRMQIKEMRE